MKSTESPREAGTVGAAEDDVGFADFLAVILKKRWLIIIPTLVGVIIAGAVFVASSMKRTEESSLARFEARSDLIVFNDYMDIVNETLMSDELLAGAFISPDGAERRVRPGLANNAAFEWLNRDTSVRSLNRERSIRVVRLKNKTSGVAYRQITLALSAESEAAASLAMELALSSLDKTVREWNMTIKADYLAQVDVKDDDPVAIAAFANYLAQRQIVVIRFTPVEVVSAPLISDAPSVNALLTIVAMVFCLSIIMAFVVTWLQAFFKDEGNRRKLKEALSRRSAR